MLIQGKELRCRRLCCIADVEGVKEMAKRWMAQKMMKGKKREKKNREKGGINTDKLYKW